MITQTLTLFKITIFTWEACFVRARIVYNAVIKSAITFDSSVWYASYERSNNIDVTTKAITKIQHNCLRIINEGFKATLIEILKTKTKMILIQLHITKLQINIKSRLEQHEHDVIIKNRCEKIKRRLTRTRDRRTHNANNTSKIKKKKWFRNICNNMSQAKLIKNQSSEKIIDRHFQNEWKKQWRKYQKKHAKHFLNICAALKNPFRKNKLTLHTKLTKSQNALITQMRTERIKLACYLHAKKMSTFVNSTCVCGYDKQTLRHVLLFCSSFWKKRESMFIVDETHDYHKFLFTAKNLKAAVK